MLKCPVFEQIFIYHLQLHEKYTGFVGNYILPLFVRYNFVQTSDSYLYFPLDGPGTWSQCQVVTKHKP